MSTQTASVIVEPAHARMNAIEIRASLALASIFALRMLGLFLILPVFAVHARTLPDGGNAMLVGLALGIYGLMQAFLHIPLGMLSDRIGRKPVIAGGLVLFVAGALVAALADSLLWITIGRAIQGAGAISAAITALLADLTREEHRTKAMAMVGGSIALTFALSLMIASPLYRGIGMDGMFSLMSVLGVAALLVVLFLVPTPAHAVQGRPEPLRLILSSPDLLRLNLGVLVLHACQVAMFMVVPKMMLDAGLALDTHWQIYLPVVLLSFCLMLWPMMHAGRYNRNRGVLLGAVAVMLLAQLAFAALAQVPFGGLLGIGAALLLFFTAFNILEATQPALVSRFAERARGTAMGVYNTTQALGLFIGGAIGGWLLDLGGRSLVFEACAAMLVLWLIIAWNMNEAPKRDMPAHGSP